MSKIRSLAIALGASVSLLAMAPAHAETVLRIANFGEPDTLDPHNMSGTWENRLAGELYMGLTTEAADASVIPGMATSWKISEDGLVYTFTLRDATWSDGMPVTADDFVYAMRRIMDPKRAAKYASLLYTVKNAEEINSGKETDFTKLGVRAIDSKTLEITLKSPTPYFLQQLTHYTAFPVPKHVVEKHGNDWVKVANHVGNGPYKLTSYTPNDKIEMAKNAKFYEASKLKIDKVVFFANESRDEMQKRFRAGEIDWTTDFDSSQIEALKKSLAKETRIAPYLGTYYFVMNTESGPTADAKVRRALSMVVDREIITNQILKTGEIPAYSIVPPGMGGIDTGAQATFAKTPMPQRIEQAKKLLAEAGYGPNKPLKVELRYNTSENHKRITVAIAGMFKQHLGVDSELVNTDVKIHYNTLGDGNFNIGRAGWIADYNDAQNFLYLFESNTGRNNYGRFKNKQFDDLMNQASKTTDLKKRAGILKQAEQVAIDGDAWMPIYFYVSKNLVSNKIKGYVDNAKDIHRVRWMSLASN